MPDKAVSMDLTNEKAKEAALLIEIDMRLEAINF